MYLNDCPHRRVVLMQSSVRLVGSLCHSAARKAMVNNSRRRVHVEAHASTSEYTIARSGLGDRGNHAKDTLRQPRLSLTRFPRRQPQSPQKHRVPKFGQLHVVDSSVVS